MKIIRRPQRILTEDELEIIRGLSLLCLHRALIQGLVDPVPNPSPMSEEDAAWVREHAWKPHDHEIEKGYPFGWHRYGNCERGTCWNCFNRRCDLCVHRQKGGPDRDDGTSWVFNHRGVAIATLFTRPPGVECVWWCRCPCDKTEPLSTEPLSTEPAPASTSPTRPGPGPRRAPHTPSVLPDPLF